jgi:hypothetical protein
MHECGARAWLRGQPLVTGSVMGRAVVKEISDPMLHIYFIATKDNFYAIQLFHTVRTFVARLSGLPGRYGKI